MPMKMTNGIRRVLEAANAGFDAAGVPFRFGAEHEGAHPNHVVVHMQVYNIGEYHLYSTSRACAEEIWGRARAELKLHGVKGATDPSHAPHLTALVVIRLINRHMFNKVIVDNLPKTVQRRWASGAKDNMRELFEVTDLLDLNTLTLAPRDEDLALVNALKYRGSDPHGTNPFRTGHTYEI